MSVENYLFAIPPHKIKLGLERTEKLLKACGNPQKKNRIYTNSWNERKGLNIVFFS